MGVHTTVHRHTSFLYWVVLGFTVPKVPSKETGVYGVCGVYPPE